VANKELMTGGLGRRQFLKLAGSGALGVLAGGSWPHNDPTTASQLTAADRKPRSLPDLDLSLIARPARVPILPGEPTRVWLCLLPFSICLTENKCSILSSSPTPAKHSKIVINQTSCISDGFVKSAEIKACESRGVRRVYGYSAVTRDDA
jgi:hypothetical protein